METLLNGHAELHCGDCRAVMADLPEASFDACVTDPPYHLASIVKRFGADGAAPALSNGATGVYKRASAGFMGKTWDGGAVAFEPATWAAVLRVLKPGAHLVAFAAPKNAHRLTCAIEDAGFEIRDVVMWLFGTGFPKSHNVDKAIDRMLGAEREAVAAAADRRGDGSVIGLGHSGQLTSREPATPQAAEWRGWGTALKPAYEPIVLARKPLDAGFTIAANCLQHGTGAINVDACRVAHVTVGGGSLALSPHLRWTINGGNGGNIFPAEAERRVVTPNELGRWPANIAHDGSEDVLELFPNTSSGALTAEQQINGGWSGSVNCYGTAQRGGTNEYSKSRGSAARFFYCAKANADERAGSKHPTVKPLALMQWLVRLVARKGGRIIDPFAGTGATAEAAHRESVDTALIEADPQSQADIRRRLHLAYAGPEERANAIRVARGEVAPF